VNFETEQLDARAARRVAAWRLGRLSASGSRLPASDFRLPPWWLLASEENADDNQHRQKFKTGKPRKPEAGSRKSKSKPDSPLPFEVHMASFDS
jgi:hypothetical protein